MSLSPEPLSPEEEALYREGLRNAPTVTDGVPWSLVQLTTAEWADRCRRLLATLDVARRTADAEGLTRALRALDERIVAEHPEHAVELLEGGAEAGRRDYAIALAAEYVRLANEGAG